MTSELRVDNLKGSTTGGSINVLGEGTSATTNLQQGVAKSWCNIQGKSTASIVDSFNTASMTDAGTGLYDTVFTNNMSNDDYAVVGSSGTKDNLGGNNPERIMRFSNAATGNVQARCRTSTGGAADDSYVGVIIAGTN